MALVPSNAYAQGGLYIFPKRIVFEGTSKRVKTVHLTNNGSDTMTYRISHIELEMAKDGRLVERDTLDANQNLASKYLRVFPRLVTLSPGESQVVKIQMVNEKSLRNGEYRSHLYFRPVLKPNSPVQALTDQSSKEKIEIKLNYVYGMSIANIIRIGDPQIKVSIDSLQLTHIQKHRFSISMDFERSGNVSSYGSIVIEYISPKGKTVHLKTIKGYAIYTPGMTRKSAFDINITEDMDMGQGKIRVIYTEDGNGRMYAQQTLNL